jgi:endoglycosylceramidase
MGFRVIVLLGRCVVLVALMLLALKYASVKSEPLRSEVGPPARPPGPGLSWLSVSNAGIVDDLGRRVLLRGFNSTSLLEWPRQPIAPLDADDLELMRRAGFNVLRLPMAWSLLEPERGNIDHRYLDRIAATVRDVNRAGLYVILDLHMTLAWGPHFGGAGAPRWAAVPMVPHVAAGEAGDWVEAVSPAVLAANTYFWLQPDWQADYALTWRAIAARFRDTSGVVGYDLFNEPNAAPLLPRLFEEQWMWPLEARLIEAIGEVDPNHLFFVEPALAYDLPSRVVAFHTANLVYAPHVYTGSLSPPSFAENPDELVKRIRHQAADAADLPAIPWWGELGIDTGKPHAAMWADMALDCLDDLDAGWAWWQWRQDWGWGVRNGAGDFFNDDFLRHLARPFLAAAPAGVHAGRGDGVRGRLRLTVDSDHADAPALVAWPATLGAPTAIGACVSSSAWDARQGQLELLLLPGAACSVDITQRERADDGLAGRSASR